MPLPVSPARKPAPLTLLTPGGSSDAMGPIAGLPASVSHSDNPDISRSADEKQSKREVLQPELPHTGNVPRGREPLRIRHDSFEPGLNVLFKTFSKPLSATFTVERDGCLELGMGFRVKFERPGTGRHLHLLECSKGIHALRDPSSDFLNPLGNFLPECWIESCGIGSVMDGGDETLVH